MKQLWKLDWVEFEKKIKLWGIHVGSLTKMIREVNGDFFIFYLPTPEADYCVVIHKDDLSPVMKMDLMTLSIPGTLIKEEIILDRKKMDILDVPQLPANFDRRLDSMEQQVKRARDSGVFK